MPIGQIFANSVTQVQAILEGLRLDTTRRPYEDDQAYVDRLISEAPPVAIQRLADVRARARKPPYECEGDCFECLQQFRTVSSQEILNYTYSATLTWKEAQKKCDAWVEEINTSQAYLRNAISKHGNAIVNRWRKRSVTNRVSLLQQVYPAIAQKKHELIDRNYVELLIDSRAKHRNFYLATYLTLDQLTSDPMKMLSLLNARANYDAEQWVAHDVAHTKLGWLTGKFDVDFCDSSVVMFGLKYGEVVKWKKHQAHRWSTIGYPRAQLVLESQALVLCFLRRVIEKLLAGVEIQSLSSKWDELVRSGFRRSREEESWAVLSNQAYLWPPNFDTNKVLEVCEARLAMAQDDLWLLQTDPSYMQHTVKLAREMKINKQYLRMNDQFDICVCRAAVLLPVERVQEWHDVVAECQNLHAVHQLQSDTIRAGATVPPDYDVAAGCLELMVINLIQVRTANLMEAIRGSKSFEDHFFYTQGPTPKHFIVKPKTQMDSSQIFKTDPLFWSLFQMTGHPDDADMIDPAVLFAFFDDLLEKDSSAANRVESQILDVVSDLAALWEVLRAVRFQRPLTRNLNIKEALSVRSGGWWEATRAIQKNPDMFKGKENKEMYTRVKALIAQSVSVKMPSGRRDQAWLQQADRSRAALNKLWASFRQTRQTLLRNAGRISEEFVDADLARISFDTAVEHQETLHAERVEIMARVQKQKLSVPSSDTARAQWSGSEPKKLDNRNVLLQAREKVKTRGQPAPGPVDEERASHDTTPAEDSDTLPKIALKPESLQIFHHMFPAEDEVIRGLSSPVDWRKFVAAMSDAGFTSRQNAGSAVTFSNQNGRIVFHRPHPIAKIDYHMLLRIGKRMNKWFDLEWGSFEAA